MYIVIVNFVVFFTFGYQMVILLVVAPELLVQLVHLLGEGAF
jgi:hypothetical protein